MCIHSYPCERGKALDWGLKDCWFKSNHRGGGGGGGGGHCDMSLSKTLYLLLSTASTEEDLPQHD